jgi:hypothetical protein
MAICDKLIVFPSKGIKQIIEMERVRSFDVKNWKRKYISAPHITKEMGRQTATFVSSSLSVVVAKRERKSGSECQQSHSPVDGSDQ